MSTNQNSQQAELYRMMMPDHMCPFGRKALHLLNKNGYAVNDHHLTSREETDRFKEEHDVKTTPQIFIGDRRIGGYDDLRRFLGMSVPSDKETSYRPVLAVFAMTALTALALSAGTYGNPITLRALEWFISLSMIFLAVLKLQDIETFSTMFLNYDLLAQKWVPYGYLYPYAEGLAGVLMFAGLMSWLSVPVALFVGSVGAFSVFKAVYIDNRDIKCACVGGSGSVPLGFVSLTENLMMIAMALWMGRAWFA